VNVIAHPKYYEIHEEAWDTPKEVPRVTSILHAAGCMGGQWWTPESRDRGTRVHLATRLLDEGKLNWAALRDDERPYVEAWQAFKAENKVNILAVEEFLCDELYRYAGTCDRKAYIYFGRDTALVWLLDIKTGTPDPWHGLQLAAYARLLQQSSAQNPYRAGVYLQPNGRYKFAEYSDPTDFTAWDDAVGIMTWRRNNGRWKLKSDNGQTA
jgi:hypothetical protein